MHGHLKHFLKDLDHEIKRENGKLIITIEGEDKELEKLEKVLKAMQQLHEACGDDCCSGHGKNCC